MNIIPPPPIIDAGYTTVFTHVKLLPSMMIAGCMNLVSDYTRVIIRELLFLDKQGNKLKRS